MKMEMRLTPPRLQKRKRRNPRRRWNPEDKSIYAKSVDVNIAILRAEDAWRKSP